MIGGRVAAGALTTVVAYSYVVAGIPLSGVRNQHLAATTVPTLAEVPLTGLPLKSSSANAPDLNKTLLEAIMDTLDAHSTMSTQALESEEVRERLKGILLGPAQLCEALRQ